MAKILTNFWSFPEALEHLLVLWIVQVLSNNQGNIFLQVAYFFLHHGTIKGRPSLMGVMLDFQLVLLHASTFCNSEACFRKKFFPKLSDFVKIPQFLKISKISILCLHFWKSILNHRKPSKIKIFFQKINTKTRRFLLCDQTQLMVSWSWDSQPENLAGV